MLEQEFNALAAEGYNRIPVTLETFADLDTPLSIYLKLANEPYTYLLESVQGGERFGRYSFIGLSSPTRIEVYDRSALLLTGNRLVERRDYGDPLNFVAEFMNRIKVPPRGTCRASPAAWSAASATTRCATSSPSWPRPTSQTPSARPTSCCCCPRKSPSSTTSAAS